MGSLSLLCSLPMACLRALKVSRELEALQLLGRSTLVDLFDALGCSSSWLRSDSTACSSCSKILSASSSTFVLHRGGFELGTSINRVTYLALRSSRSKCRNRSLPLAER